MNVRNLTFTSHLHALCLFRVAVAFHNVKYPKKFYGMETTHVKDLSNMIIQCVKSAARELHVQRVISADQWLTCEIVALQ